MIAKIFSNKGNKKKYQLEFCCFKALDSRTFNESSTQWLDYNIDDNKEMFYKCLLKIYRLYM